MGYFPAFREKGRPAGVYPAERATGPEPEAGEQYAAGETARRGGKVRPGTAPGEQKDGGRGRDQAAGADGADAGSGNGSYHDSRFLKYVTDVYLAAPAAEREEKMKLNQLKGMREFIREEDGMGTVEIILIIVVLVGLVIIFKGQIIQIINSLFQKITSQTGTV